MKINIKELEDNTVLEIRKETKKDFNEVYNVVKVAFETAEHSDGNEQDLVVALRKSENFIPDLSLVAVLDNKIVGYILFTKIKIGKYEEICLAPLAVLPEYQRKGIGKNLIERGHEIARNLNYHYSIVLGDQKYYSKFNYLPSITYNIKAPFKVSPENFMAIKLNELEIEGIVEYAKEFGI